MNSLGKQIIAELYHCDRDSLDDVEYIRRAMTGAAREAGASIVTQTFHHFSPYGVSGAVIITDSHLAIHTWPEYDYAAVDLFTCGVAVSSKKAIEFLREALKSQQLSVVELHRGPKVGVSGADSELQPHRSPGLAGTGSKYNKVEKLSTVAK
ncbi:MAG: adenosylmethionine decarboxylase [Gammaproteobacteria bacterium]|nr:adenosylmethionine decarboxylase [Gammaproteobacteria bacterium]